jgi:spore germination cell wall hydrolase CwlJ-like protein
MIANELATIIVAGVLMLHPEPPTAPLEEVMCVTEAIWFEARGESVAGKYAVAHTIRNRVNSSRFPNSYCEVVNQPRQFSYLNEGRPTVEVRNHIDALAFEWSVRIAVDLVNDTLGSDITHQSKHYFNPYKANPYWRNYGNEVGMVGNHLFLNQMRNR